MSTGVLGSYTFLEMPDVLGVPFVLNQGNTSSFFSGTFVSRPAPGNPGSVFLSTDTAEIFRDDGSSWVLISNTSTSVVKQTIFSPIGSMSGNSTIPLSAGTPTTSQGSQIWSQAITPSSTSSRIQISGTFLADTGNSSRGMTAALFRGTTCIAVAGTNVVTATRSEPIVFNTEDLPNTTSPVTYTIRFGIQANATWYVNRSSYYGGLYANNGITLTEVL